MVKDLETHLRGTYGRAARHFESTDSTNTRALAWAAEGAPDGAVVTADHQTAGRGRLDRRWVGSPATLMFSVILRPRLSSSQTGLLTQAAGLAVAEALEVEAGLGPRLKWPNDVLLDDLKVAGILLEGRFTSEGALEAVVVGIGLNTHWRAEEIPPEIGEIATSVAIAVDGEPPTRERLLATILERLEAWVRAAHEDPAALVARASEASAILGDDVVVHLPKGERLVGRAVGIDADGALEVEVDGETRRVVVGDVVRLAER